VSGRLANANINFTISTSNYNHQKDFSVLRLTALVLISKICEY
jgi:hypothetical protein